MKSEDFLIKGDGILEESMLKAVLLFNEAKQGSSRKDMLQKALLSLIIEGDNKMTLTDIRKAINERFSLTWTDKDANEHVKRLESLQLVITTETGQVKVCESRKDGRSFTREVIADTDAFLDRVIQKIQSAYKSTLPAYVNYKAVVKKAMTAYFRHSGLEFVNFKKSATSTETVDAIECIKQDIREKRLAELTIRALADTLINPTEEDLAILEKWARAFISMQVIGLDPVLANFKESKLRGKSFVIDTDVILNCITKNAFYSKDYGVMIKKLREIGCALYIPEEVIGEVEAHCKASKGTYSKYFKEQLLNMTDDMLRQSVGNVIVEDYVNYIRKHPDQADYEFDIYLENFYDRDDSSLLINNLCDTFGSRNMDNKLPDLVDEEKKVEVLKKRIFEYTEQSAKGELRTQEVNAVLSEFDAILYLTICEMNEDSDEGDFFANKTYLLTSMKKGIKSAKELGQYSQNIICSPQALLGILAENGQIHTDSVSIVSLMDNPFLVYTATQIWKEVEPLLNAGAKIKYKELNRLRMDVDTKIDKILTCNTPEERYVESKRLEENNYFFGQDIIEATEKAQVLETTVKEKDKTIEEQSGIISEQSSEIEKLREENQRLKDENDHQRRKEKFEDRIKGRTNKSHKPFKTLKKTEKINTLTRFATNKGFDTMEKRNSETFEFCEDIY